MNFIACSFQCKKNLTWICSAFGRNQWGLQVSLKCFCCCSFSFHLLHPIKFNGFSCIHAQDRQSWEWGKNAMRKFVFLLLLPKLFKCYLHEIYSFFKNKLKLKTEEWIHFMQFLSSEKFFFGILKLFSKNATGKKENINKLRRSVGGVECVEQRE